MRSAHASDSGSKRAAGRVLVVEDDPDNTQLVTYILTRAGFDVEHRPAPLDALCSFEAGRYDLLLSDLRLPGIDGTELAQRARAIDAGLPVVLMTAHASFESTTEAGRAGVSAVLRKPLRATQLVDAVVQAIRQRPTDRHRPLSDRRPSEPVTNANTEAPA